MEPDTDEVRALFERAAAAAADHRVGLDDRPVGAVDPDASRAAFDGPLPDGPTAAAEVLDELIAAAEPGLVATAGPRYFGFVIGGALPVATAADMVAAGWDQCAFNAVLSPAAMAAEAAAGRWLKELLGIPESASVGFVTGGQEANTVGLACGRHHVLAEHGWDVEARGLHGAPPLRVLAGSERHATIDRAVRLLGIGTDAVVPVAVDDQGAIDVAALERTLAGEQGPALLCLQAGNVNTGACDDLAAACAIAHDRGAWVHVDGAFGLWAGAGRTTRGLVEGLELADSWGCDGHKWLNVPYDAGYVFCARPEVHAASVAYAASYLVGSGTGVVAGADGVLQSSRRARGFATWAALRHLGRRGVADLVDRCCVLARRFADRLGEGGLEVVNEVVLNQVLVDVGPHADAVAAAVQQDGTCWLGGTTWRGRRLLRVSISNWRTGEDDVDRSAAAVLAAAASD